MTGIVFPLLLIEGGGGLVCWWLAKYNARLGKRRLELLSLLGLTASAVLFLVTFLILERSGRGMKAVVLPLLLTQSGSGLICWASYGGLENRKLKLLALLGLVACAVLFL